MVYLDEILSEENGKLIYKMNYKNPSIEIIKFNKRIVEDDKICYVILICQENRYFLFGAKYQEVFIGFEINKSEIDIIKDYFKSYEIERLINLGIFDYGEKY